MKKKSLIAIIVAAAVAVGAAIAIPVTVHNCNSDNKNNEKPDDPDKPNPPDPPGPDKPDPEKTYATLSERVDLAKLGADVVPYCCTVLNYPVLNGDGTFSKTQTQDYYLFGASVVGSPTRLYVSAGSGILGYVTLYQKVTNPDTKAPEKKYYTADKGNIVTNGQTLWLTDGENVGCAYYRYQSDYKELGEKLIAGAKENAEIEINYSFKPYVSPDFLCYVGNTTEGTLYIGESGGESSTGITINDLDYGLVMAYRAYIDEFPNLGNKTGLMNLRWLYAIPKGIISTAIHGDNLTMLSDEKLFTYDWSSKKDPMGINNEARGISFEKITGNVFSYAGVEYPDMHVRVVGEGDLRGEEVCKKSVSGICADSAGKIVAVEK